MGNRAAALCLLTRATLAPFALKQLGVIFWFE